MARNPWPCRFFSYRFGIALNRDGHTLVNAMLPLGFGKFIVRNGDAFVEGECNLLAIRHGEYQLVPLLLHPGTGERLFDFGLEFVHAAGNRKAALVRTACRSYAVLVVFWSFFELGCASVPCICPFDCSPRIKFMTPRAKAQLRLGLFMAWPSSCAGRSRL